MRLFRRLGQLRVGASAALAMLVLLLGAPAIAAESPWAPAHAPLMTRWARDVSPQPREKMTCKLVRRSRRTGSRDLCQMTLSTDALLSFTAATQAESAAGEAGGPRCTIRQNTTRHA